MKRKSHPYADLFPMMTAAELEALAADVAENGLRHPVVLYHGEVLDGRNRLLACEKAGVEPDFTEHQGDDASALALVISLNVQRRDLTAGQRAVVSARTWMARRTRSRAATKRNGRVLLLPRRLRHQAPRTAARGNKRRRAAAAARKNAQTRNLMPTICLTEAGGLFSSSDLAYGLESCHVWVWQNWMGVVQTVV